MRHYEIVVLIHPDQSDQSSAMVERYKESLKNQGEPYIGLKIGGVYSRLSNRKNSQSSLLFDEYRMFFGPFKRTRGSF